MPTYFQEVKCIYLCGTLYSGSTINYLYFRPDHGKPSPHPPTMAKGDTGVPSNNFQLVHTLHNFGGPPSLADVQFALAGSNMALKGTLIYYKNSEATLE